MIQIEASGNPLTSGSSGFNSAPHHKSPVISNRAFYFSGMFYVYILQSVLSNQFYKGISNDLKRRLKEHNAGYEKATAPFKPWNLVWFTTKPDKSEAILLETKLKNLTSHVRIIKFIQKYKPVGGPDVPPLVEVRIQNL